MGQARLNVHSCRLASRSTSTRRPDESGLPQMIGRQNPARQQRIGLHRRQPGFPFVRRPASQRLGRARVRQFTRRTAVEHFQMARVAALDLREVPGPATTGCAPCVTFSK